MTAIALATLVGCDKPVPTDAQDVLDYVRNSTVRADVRQLDRDAQEYVETVMKAERAWHKKLTPLLELADIDEFWDEDADEWRDPEKVGKQLGVIYGYFIGRIPTLNKADKDSPATKPPDSSSTTEEAGEKKDSQEPTHADLLAKLNKAIDKTPKDLKAVDSVDVLTEVRTLLKMQEKSARCEQIAANYRDLLMLIMSQAHDFDPTAKGLTFTSAAATKQAHALWTKLHDRLQADRDAELAKIEERLSKGRAQQRDADIEAKRELRKAGLDDEANKRQFRRLELLIHYHDTVIKGAEKRKRTLDSKTRDEEKARQEAGADKATRDAA